MDAADRSDGQGPGPTEAAVGQTTTIPADQGNPVAPGTEAVGSPSGTDTGSSAPPQAAAPAAVREDQVQNAVTFLSHPKVRESTTAIKRSFLERKGLTAAEIDEAFRRVPESSGAPAATAPGSGSYTPAPAPSSAAAAGGYTPTSVQAPQSAVMANGAAPPPKPYHQTAMVPVQPVQQLAPPQQQGMRWTQIVVSGALLAAGAYTVHSLLWPKARSLYDKWSASWHSEQQRKTDEAAANAKLIADALESQSAELRSTVASLKQLISAMDSRQQAEQAAAADQSALMVEGLRQELQAMTTQLRSAPPPAPIDPAPALQRELHEIKGLLAASAAAPRAASPPTYATTAPAYAAAPAPPTYATTAPPYAAAAAPAYAAAAAPAYATAAPPYASEPVHAQWGGLRPVKPAAPPAPAAAESGRWPDPLERSPSYGSTTHAERFPVAPASRTGVYRGVPSPTVAAQEAGVVSAFASARAASGTNGPDLYDKAAPPLAAAPGSPGGPGPDAPDADAPPHPASYMNVLQMLERGETPPGIRSDINDSPPDPAQPPSEGRLQARPKPWERAASSSAAPSSGPPSAGGSAGPHSRGASPSPGAPASPAKLLQPGDAAPRSSSLMRMAGADANGGAGSNGQRRGFTYGEVVQNGSSSTAQMVMTSLTGAEAPATMNGAPAAGPAVEVAGAVGGAGSSSGGAGGAPGWRPPPLPQPSLSRTRSSNSISSAA